MAKRLIYLNVCITTFFLFCFWVLPSVTMAKEKVSSTEEIIDPHFTGKDCDVCHEAVPQPGQKDLQLKFGGDDIAMCNSCHEKENVKGDLHPVGIASPEGDVIRVPDELTLYDGNVTCRTCHDVYLQCQGKPSVQFENINFLRGAPYKKTTDLCFRCHNKEVYKKINPHEQIDEEGNIVKKQCLYCHQSLPDPDAVSDITGVTFKTATATFCATCHGEEEALHPAEANHITTPSEEMLAAIEASEKRFGVILPLFKGDIFCGTCHNPHDKGIIKREEASRGADVELKLRLDWSKDLCIACHNEKAGISPKAVSPDEIIDKDLITFSRGEGIPSYHQSFLEKKCRACHIITRESPERPIVYKMCFQTDCHDTSILQDRFKHSEALEANCLLCHSQHGSQYGAHIVNDQQKLCKACHPLFRPVETGVKREKGKDLHDTYLGLFQELVTDQEMTCSYCHGEDHSDRVKEKGILECYRCHNYIDRVVKDQKEKSENVHETLPRFAGNKCTLCHNPHSSPFPDLLKEEPESYK